MKGDLNWALSLTNIHNSKTQQVLKPSVNQGGKYALEIISPFGEKSVSQLVQLKILFCGIKFFRKSCANAYSIIPGLRQFTQNGDCAARGLREFVEVKNEPDLLVWIENSTSAPNGMVDRIILKFHPDILARS